MFEMNDRFKAAMTGRLEKSPVNARLILIAGDVSYDETILPEGTLSLMSYSDGKGYSLTVSQSLPSRTLNQVCAHALGHLLLHSDKFSHGTTHADMYPGYVSAFQDTDPLTQQHDSEANKMGIEILIPTVVLREKLTYTQGSIVHMAEIFDVQVELIHAALVKAKLLDPRSTYTDVA
jgi:Zn-dependent peptidase ImmA (M78 family)